MKKIALLLCLSLVINVKTIAQQQKEIYQFAEDINRDIEKDTLAWKYQLGATAHSFGQHYAKALQAWDKNGAMIPKITAADSLYFSLFRPINAIDYIVNRAKDEKVIIINEAHHEARHRVFTEAILQGLYNNGYRLLGLEALADTLINKRGFPIISSGYYTQEPQLANLISTALKIGFVVFGYEAEDGKNGKEREIAQANHIAEMMAKHPGAKVLIHCGFDHVIEGTPGNRSWEKAMAGRLKELTNIDPFTIDQVSYTEKGNFKYNSPYIALAKSTSPVIMINAKGETFNGPKGTDRTDCRVIHPIGRIEEGRAHWLNLGLNRKSYRIPKRKISAYPALVLAYRINEYHKNGIPADIIELHHQQDVANLILARGTYQIIIKNADYQTIIQYQQKIR